eukprot:scaffold83301_cov25-Cyclotella_meneghiniana.AAC.1
MNKDLNCTLSEKKNGNSYDVPSSNYETLCNANAKSSSSNNINDTSSTTSNDVRSNIIQPSTALQGKLVARVLPHSYGEYNTRQSVRGRVNDARELIQCLHNSNKTNCGVGSTVSEFNLMKGVGKLQKIESIQHCSENVVALDVYLLRMDRGLKQRHPNSNDPTLINHAITNHSNENVLRLRMNRSSNESASRTLRRLEVSTMNKLKGMLPTNSKRSTNRTFPSGETMCQLIRIGEYDKDVAQSSDSKCRHYVPMDISELSSEDIWNHCAEQGNDNCKIALTLPSSIISGRNSSSQQSSTLECVELDIISNPPTLLSVETFENFTSHIFVGVPIVLRTTIIYATHATITWFANNEVVYKDCHVYTPTLDDVGKRLSVLITPVRLDHNGEGCQEAYSFSRLVEVLPTMPIVELRQNWIHRKCESSTGTTTDRLRVLTYNILADLYAGREIDQKFMYSHCDPEYLARGRRMP